MEIKIPIWMKIMLFLESMNASQISYKVKSNYCVILKNIEGMQKEGFVVKKEKTKRENEYYLTARGKKIKDACITLKQELEGSIDGEVS